MADPADRGAADGGAADGGAADGGAADPGAPDADPADGGAAETGPTETGPTEAGAAEAGPADPAARRRRRRGRGLLETAVLLLVAVLLAGLVRAYVFQTFWIPSASMVPTLGVYDRILVQKAFFSWHDVREGDIVVFTHPPLDHCFGPQGGDLVKRVIALPGQTIYSSGNNIYINGKLLAEPYLPHYDPLGPPIPNASRQHPYRVPAGEFYLLGDNRAISCDSRFWGPIKGSTIVGKVVLVWWHDSHPEFHWF
jgi:signal peptidase I